MNSDIRIIAIGDSITQGHRDETGRGWLGYLVERGRAAELEMTVYPLGIRRDATPQLAARAGAEIAARLRDAAEGAAPERRLLVGVGVADAVQDIPRVTTEAGLDAVAAIARTLGLPVAILGPPPVVGLGPDARQVVARVAEIAEWLPEYSRARALHHIGLHDGPLGEDWPSLLGDDGYHPTAAGYRRMGEALVEQGLIHWLRTSIS